MDDVISKALKQRRYLLSEINKIDKFIEVYEDLTGTKVQRDEMVLSSDSKPRKTTSKPLVTRRVASHPRVSQSPNRIAKAAEAVIREAGVPVVRGDIVARIEEKGVRIQSSDKARYVGTILWRERDTFRNIEGRGYWLKSLGAPPELSGANLSYDDLLS